VPKHNANNTPHGPRSTWRGSLSFGLVSIPVELIPATRPAAHRAHMLDGEGKQLTRHYYCPKDGKELAPEDIVRGHELPDGRYVVVEDSELEALAPKKSREIDVQLFVERSALHPSLFERAYLLAPAKEENKAYRLLVEVMHRKARVGIATFVLHEREYIIAIFSDGAWLQGETLRFVDELRSVDELGLPKSSAPKALATKYANALAHKRVKHFDPKLLIAPGQHKLAALIETKRKQGKVLANVAAPAEGSEPESALDLMRQLKRSLQSSSSTKPTATHRAGSIKRSKASKSRKPSGAARQRRAQA
jgi:DNA end-binding protein Ku